MFKPYLIETFKLSNDPLFAEKLEDIVEHYILVINEHYNDTGGFSDHVFAMCHLLDFRFAQRVRARNEKRRFASGGPLICACSAVI